MKHQTAVRAIIVSGSKLLCVRLKPYSKRVPMDFWCLPGGHVDKGEALIPALKREMIEETGVKPRVGELLYIHQFMSGNTDVLEFFFHVINFKDYDKIDLSKTTHGGREIEEIAFINPKKSTLLPLFLTTVDLNAKIAHPNEVTVFQSD